MPAWLDELSREQDGRRKIRHLLMRAKHRSQGLDEYDNGYKLVW